MNLKIYRTHEASSNAVAQEIITLLNKEPKSLICIAAGHTSLKLFDLLIDAYKNKQVDFSHASFVAMDEWLNMNEHTKDSCGYLLRKSFLDHTNFPEDHICLFDGKNPDAQAECQRVLAFIDQSPSKAIDYLVLGTGMNGHLALNEPGCDLSLYSQVTLLDQVTAKVGQKYFKSQTSLVGGVTLGVGTFSKAHAIVLLINGSRKSRILSQLLASKEVTNALPATAIFAMNNAFIYCDEDAAEELDTTMKWKYGN